MCWACNPFCGRCKPPKMRVVVCPACSKEKAFRKDELLKPGGTACAGCGEPITIEAVLCARSGLMCAWPCKRCDEPTAEGPVECPYNTPPSAKE